MVDRKEKLQLTRLSRRLVLFTLLTLYQCLSVISFNIIISNDSRRLDIIRPTKPTTTTSTFRHAVVKSHHQHDDAGTSSSATPPMKSRKKHRRKKTNTRQASGVTSNNGKGSNNRGRTSKEDLNNLIRDIGLTPVETKKRKNDDKKSTVAATATATAVAKNNSSKSSDVDDLNSIHLPSSILSLETQLQYSRNGHAVIRAVFPKSTLTHLREDLIQYADKRELHAWKQKVEVATRDTAIVQSCNTVMECQQILQQQSKEEGDDEDDDTLQIPFLQHFNTWRSISSVKSFVTSPLLSNMARTLLDVKSVRLYQDSLFHKRSQDGPTPWHSDARMAPFDTSNMITFWIPFNPIPKDGTGLLFVDKSHCDFALPYWNRPKFLDYVSDTDNDEPGEYDRLDERYGGEDSIKHYMPLAVGDCTVHAGWTLHSANGGSNSIQNGIDNSTSGMEARYALAVTYVDAKAEIREDVVPKKEKNGDDDETSNNNNVGHDEDRWSFQDWIVDVNAREQFEHNLVPIVWPTKK